MAINPVDDFRDLIVTILLDYMNRRAKPFGGVLYSLNERMIKYETRDHARGVLLRLWDLLHKSPFTVDLDLLRHRVTLLEGLEAYIKMMESEVLQSQEEWRKLIETRCVCLELTDDDDDNDDDEKDEESPGSSGGGDASMSESKVREVFPCTRCCISFLYPSLHPIFTHPLSSLIWFS